MGIKSKAAPVTAAPRLSACLPLCTLDSLFVCGSVILVCLRGYMRMCCHFERLFLRLHVCACAFLLTPGSMFLCVGLHK